MDYIQTLSSFAVLDYLFTLISMLDLSIPSISLEGFKVFPDEYQGRVWNNFDASVQAALANDSTSRLYKEFVYLVLKIMAFMTFGFSLYDSALVLAGQGSAAEHRGGKGKALAKNGLIMVVALLAFEAEVVLNGIWAFLKG